MAQNVDVKLEKDAEGIYDIGFGANGDFDQCQGFDTALKMSIFCEKRATDSEVQNPLRRRGWIGNIFATEAGFEIGSKLWLFEQARLNNETINGVRGAVLNGLQWLLDDGLATSVEAVVSRLDEESVGLAITVSASSGVVEERFYTLWELTGR